MPEEETFCVFVHLMNHYKLRELYKPTMADLGLRFYQLENLVEVRYSLSKIINSSIYNSFHYRNFFQNLIFTLKLW